MPQIDQLKRKKYNSEYYRRRRRSRPCTSSHSISSDDEPVDTPSQTFEVEVNTCTPSDNDDEDIRQGTRSTITLKMNQTNDSDEPDKRSWISGNLEQDLAQFYFS